MASFQKYICIGNLARDPDTRYTAGGMAVCEFTVAINGARKEDGTYYGVVVAFGKTAEACRQYLTKGSSVLVEGKLKNDEWEDKQTGQKRSKTRIYADNVQFIGRSENQRQNAQPAPAYTEPRAGKHADDLPPEPNPDQDCPF